LTKNVLQKNISHLIRFIDDSEVACFSDHPVYSNRQIGPNYYFIGMPCTVNVIIIDFNSITFRFLRISALSGV